MLQDVIHRGAHRAAGGIATGQGVGQKIGDDGVIVDKVWILLLGLQELIEEVCVATRWSPTTQAFLQLLKTEDIGPHKGGRTQTNDGVLVQKQI